jgi:hypothetical protein
MKHHSIVIAAPRDIVASGAPVILQHDDEDFIDAILNDLRTATGRGSLAGSVAATRTADHTLKLFQPVQRRFHVALLEACCDLPGKPRIDPGQIDAAGMVLRRLRSDAQGGIYREGWMRASGRLRGWVPVDRMGDAQADPAPAVRLARRATGQAQIDRKLAGLVAHTDAALLNEHVIPMFVAPPDVCSEAGRTLVYGVVQTSSSELASSPPDVQAAFDGFGPQTQAFANHLAQPLRGMAYSFPRAGQYFDSNWFEAIEQPGANPPSGKVSGVKTTMRAALFGSITSERRAAEQPDSAPLHQFVVLLRQVAFEFDAFGDSPESQALFSKLEGITLTYALQFGETNPRTVTAGTFLKSATRVLLERDPEAGALEMPKTWPELSPSARTQLANAMSQAMQARFASVKGRPGRFDEPDARYVLCAFVRLKADGACPPRTIWSDYSEPFVIAPWYEGGGAPAQIPLPDVSDRNLLKSLKPNVSFVLPPKLQNLLGNSPKDMMDGKLDDSGLSLGWICSFSIPIITLCAFIVLNIFLSLFDLFFRWMLFIKICIPFPKIGGK